tara:strand:- start:2290 stop:3510 length:1221 start_codon:yes stop_codon:yes gene_type:complete
MKELEIQKLLRSGTSLESIKETYGIKHNISGDGKLVNLKYSQIDSDKQLRVVRECRGLILEKDSWNIVSRGFERFFNYGEEIEGPEFNFNSTDLKVLEKADGSIIQIFNYEGVWRMSTSGVIDGVSNVNNGIMTFKQLFDKAAANYEGFWDKLDTNFTYVFELISPINQIVTPYEKTDLVLLNVRNRGGSSELHWNVIVTQSKEIGVRHAKVFNVRNIDEIKAACESLPEKEEGFVIVDYEISWGGTNSWDDYGCFPRIKMKSEEYVKLHYLKDAACKSVAVMVGIILDNEDAEFTVTFPELKDTFVIIRKAFEDLKAQITKDWSSVNHLVKSELTRDEKREFAAEVMKNKATSGYVFTMQKKGYKNVPKLLEALCSDEMSRGRLIRHIVDFGNLKNMNLDDDISK